MGGKGQWNLLTLPVTGDLMGGKVHSDIRDATPSGESWALFLSKSIYQGTSAQPGCSYPQSLSHSSCEAAVSEGLPIPGRLRRSQGRVWDTCTPELTGRVFACLHPSWGWSLPLQTAPSRPNSKPKTCSGTSMYKPFAEIASAAARWVPLGGKHPGRSGRTIVSLDGGGH